MPINFRGRIKFLFNKGKGIDKSQVDGFGELETDVLDLKSGKLGYNWYYAVKNSQDFVASDFTHLLEGASSGFPELDVPAFTDANTYFGAMATPLDVPEAEVARGQFSGNLLEDTGYSYRRLLVPQYIGGKPYRVYVGRRYLNLFDSGAELRLTARIRLSAYNRFAISTPTSAMPTAISDAWARSTTPVIRLGDFGGSDRFLHIALPHGVGPAPTYAAVAVDGAVRIEDALTASNQLIFDGTVPYMVYTTNAALASSTYSGKDFIILPERDNIPYYVAPTTLANGDVSFTWYAGFYSFRAGSHPENPIDAAFINAGVGVSESMMDQIVLPSDADGGLYQPDADRHYVRFVAQPATAAAIEGLYLIPLLTYFTQAEIEAAAATSFTTYWTEQTNTIEVAGQTYKAWLDRRSTSQWTPNGQSGERYHVFR